MFSPPVASSKSSLSSIAVLANTLSSCRYEPVVMTEVLPFSVGSLVLHEVSAVETEDIFEMLAEELDEEVIVQGVSEQRARSFAAKYLPCAWDVVL